MPFFTNHAIMAIPVGGTQITTFDPANKGTDIVLSNGNKTAAGGAAAASWQIVQSTTSKNTGKLYVEFLWVVVPSGAEEHASCGFGSGQNLNQYIGHTGSDGYLRAAQPGAFPGGGDDIVTFNGSNAPTYTAVAGSVIAFAIDFGAGKAWAAHNNIFGGNPAAGTSPAWTWTPAFDWQALFANNYPGGLASATIQTASGTQLYAPPAGFTPWDGV